jgi:hypothetical protein
MPQVSRPQIKFIALKSADKVELNIVYLAFLLCAYPFIN